MSALAGRTDTDQVIKAIFDVTPVVALTHEPAAGQPHRASKRVSR
jgi:hypothetical protein